MEYTVEVTSEGKRVIIDLPVSIISVDYTFNYYDNELTGFRSYTPGNWFVEEIEGGIKGFKVDNKEFLKYSTAVEYAKRIYVRYLKEEIRRVKGCDM